MKIVINKCYGGFGLSREAESLYAKKSGFDLFHYQQTEYKHNGGKDKFVRVGSDEKCFMSHAYKKDQGDEFSKPTSNKDYWYYGEIERNDPLLVEVVEELGDRANGECASLSVVNVPDGIDWEIDDYDGIESIHESHRSW